MKKTVFSLIQWTWGFPQTLIGSALYLANKDRHHFDYQGACATIWERGDALSLGKFIFLPSNGAEGEEELGKVVLPELIEHEYGHSIQSLILGPLYLLLVGLPSVIWNRLPYFQRKRMRTGQSYYAPIFEKTANILGAKKVTLSERGRDD